MKIRQATPADRPAIYQLVEQAFKTAQVSDGTEQDYVEELRKRPTFIPELELVAEEDGLLVGHVMLTEQPVKLTDGEYMALLLAPLSVEFNHRNQGIGGALMQAAFKEAVRLDKHAVFLVGNPEYYQRFGFQQAGELGMWNATTIPDQFILGKELVNGVLSEISGEIDLH